MSAVNSIPLTERYKPRHLADLRGQEWVAGQLTAFAESPHSTAFLFAGATGTGKTSAALLLAEALGVSVENEEFGGLYQIASGEQTGESVRRTMAALHTRPFCGSGWRVLIVNEADVMTPNASHVCLDALENLPRQTVVVFTTNQAGKIPARLRDRCERLDFLSGALLLLPSARDFVREVWAAETGQADAPDPTDFGPVVDEEGNISFRRLLQLMTPYVRTGQRPAGGRKAEAERTKDRSTAALKAWATRRAKQVA